MALTILPYLSPRLIVVPAPDTEVTVQQVVDEVRDWEDSEEGMTYPSIISAAGKESLGGGVEVGITCTLQNAQIYFAARTTAVDNTKLCTTLDTTGTVLASSTSTFQSDGIGRGDTVINYTTMAMATVLSVDSETQLTTLPLTGGSRQDWQVNDAIYTYNQVQGSISGGNLVAVDDVDAELDPILESPMVQVVRTAASSATTANQAQLEFATFNGGVTVDVTSSYTGTVFPVGSPSQPVNNMADAILIADERGFTRFFIRSNVTLTSGDYSSGRIFEGESITNVTITINAGANVDNCIFTTATIIGTLDNSNRLEDCLIESITSFDGFIERCGLNSTITLGGSSQTTLIDCYSNVAGSATPVVDVGTGSALAIRGWKGGIELINKTGTDDCSVDIDSGHFKVASSCTAGDIAIRGVAKLTDNSSVGCNVLAEDLLVPLRLTELYRLQGLESGSPMTVTPTSRTATGLSLVISGDGITSSTVTRS